MRVAPQDLTFSHAIAHPLCLHIHNSARSQMAEAFLNQLCSDHFEATSAGIEPDKLNPIVVGAMQEIEVDISGHQTESVFDLYRTGRTFAYYVVAVCDPIKTRINTWCAAPAAA